MWMKAGNINECSDQTNKLLCNKEKNRRGVDAPSSSGYLSVQFTSVTQSCPTLRYPMDCSLPGSSVHETLQAKYWSGLPCPPPGDLPDPGIEPTSLMSPELAGSFFTTSTTWESYSLKSINQSINLCVCFNLLLSFSPDTQTHPSYWFCLSGEP